MRVFGQGALRGRLRSGLSIISVVAHAAERERPVPARLQSRIRSVPNGRDSVTIPLLSAIQTKLHRPPAAGAPASSTARVATRSSGTRAFTPPPTCSRPWLLRTSCRSLTLGYMLLSGNGRGDLRQERVRLPARRGTATANASAALSPTHECHTHSNCRLHALPPSLR
jgi:hypothetical protein